MKTSASILSGIASRIRKTAGKLINIHDKPKKIAGGYALGCFFGVTPFIGLQVILAILVSTLFRWNKAASAIGVLNTNWMKGFFIYPLNYKIGAMILGSDISLELPDHISTAYFMTLLEEGREVLVSLMTGGLITGTVIALVYYYLILFYLKRKIKRSSINQVLAS